MFASSQKSRRLPIIAIAASLLSLLVLTFRAIKLHHTFPTTTLRPLHAVSSIRVTHEPLIPRRIWQTWLTRPAETPTPPNEELQRFAATWPGRNPGYNYARLDDASALAYVEEHFSHQPEIPRLFSVLGEPVLRADLIRYLILYASGGVWADMDTEPYRSIDLWSGEAGRGKVGMMVGLEYDQRNDEERMPGTQYRVQFSQWTIASRKGHPVMKRVMDTVVERLLEEEKGGKGFRVEKSGDVLNMTGPRIFTEAVRQGISEQMGKEVDYSEFSMMNGPKMFGDVMVLPINAFASGVPHSGAAGWGNAEQLVVHHFRGKWKEGLDDS